MKRILLISLLLLAVICTVSADRRRLLGVRNVASAAAPSPSLWIVATNVSPIASNGGNVTNLTDISGNGHTFVATVGAYPSYNTNGQNGLPTIQFGTGTILTNFSFGSTLAGSDVAFTVVAVLKRTVSAQTYFQLGSTTDADTSHAMANDGAAYRCWRRDDAGTIADVTGGTIDTSYHIITTVFSGTTVSQYDKSTAIFSAQAQDVGACTFNAAVIGGRMLGGTLSTDWASGFISEIKVWNSALSSGDRATEVSAMASKYGL